MKNVESKKEKSTTYKVITALTYLIPFVIFVYIIYINWLPFGFEKTYILNVGNEEDTDISKELYLVESDALGPRTCVEGECFRELNGTVKIKMNLPDWVDDRINIGFESNITSADDVFITYGSIVYPLYLRKTIYNPLFSNEKIIIYSDELNIPANIIKDYNQVMIYLESTNPIISYDFLEENEFPKENTSPIKVSEGYYFDGIDDYIKVNNVNITGSFAVEAVVKLEVSILNNSGYIYSDNRQTGFYVRGPSKDVRFFINTDNMSCLASFNAEEINYTSFEKITGVYDKEKEKAYILLNNNLMDIKYCSGNVINSDKRIFAIGQRDNTYDLNIQMTLQSFNIYDKFNSYLVVPKNIRFQNFTSIEFDSTNFTIHDFKVTLSK